MEKSRLRPEILAPAGDPLCLRAAIAAGADAVYLGMARFNARGRAERFRGVELASCVRAAHDHGVKVYVTLNTLLRDDELPAGIELAAEALEAGADAAIVQDPGFAALLSEKLPGLPLHASTQMTLHQPLQAAEAVRRLGLRRVILARECSLEEVRRVVEALRPLGAGVEVFVHGALCFAYSGQCLISNFAGRRSANRGICAQNCRFDYVAGEVFSELASSHPPPLPPRFDRRSATQLVSLKDLCAIPSVGALADAGVAAFKIEGRLKGPEYVAEMTRLYRAAVDAWAEGRSFEEEEAVRRARRVFTRGFTNGYLEGTVDASMRGDKRALEGEPDAILRWANRKRGILVLEPRPGHAIRPGQGYRYAHDRYQGGFRVLSVGSAETAPRACSQGVAVQVRFGAEARGRSHRRGARGRRRPPPPLPIGLACYLNDDPELEERVSKLVSGVEIPKSAAEFGLRISVRGKAGEALEARGETSDGKVAEARSSVPLEEARARALDPTVLAEHLGRLGRTRYRLESLDASGLEAGLFLPLSALNDLRRALVARLDRATGGEDLTRPCWALYEGTPRAARTRLSACVRDELALESAFRAGVECAYLEGARAIELLEGRSAASTDPASWGRPVFFRLPAIVHEENLDRAWISAARCRFPGTGVLAGHLGQLRLAREEGLPAAADFYLNASNFLAAKRLGEAGASRVAVSLELDAREAARLADRAPWEVEIEVVIGGSVPSMLTRQAFGLREGEAFLAKSEHGYVYRFTAAPGGTTAIYEARELVGPEAILELYGRVEWVRLDLARHSAQAVFEIASAYREILELMGNQGASSERVREAIARARSAHSRKAPWGVFAGHLVRGSRLLDADEPAEAGGSRP